MQENLQASDVPEIDAESNKDKVTFSVSATVATKFNASSNSNLL
jgi:hypothetical protein